MVLSTYIIMERANGEMNVQSLTLQWQKAGSFKEILETRIFDAEFSAEFSQPGIYLWLESAEERKFCSYVGKATQSLLQRTCEHYAALLQLRYSIPSRYNHGKRYVADNPSRYKAEQGYDAVASPGLMTLTQRQQKLQALQGYLTGLEIYYLALPEHRTQLQPKDFNLWLAQIEKQLISDCMPVENIRDTKQQYYQFKLVHQGVFSEQDIAVFYRNSVNELSLDRTRPTRARSLVL